MVSFILNLFAILEENGINPSISEKLDTIESLLYIDISNRKTFLDTIIANLAHSYSDSIKIQKIVESFIGDKEIPIINITEIADRIKNDSYFKREILKRIIFHNRFEYLLQILSHKTEGIAQTSYRLQDALFWETKETDFLSELFVAAKSNKAIKERLLKILNTIKQTDTSYKKGITDLSLNQKSELYSIPFFEISSLNLNRLRIAIRIAAKKITRKIRLSEQAERSSIINLHRTLRANSVYENIPFYVRFKIKRKKRRNLIILCDLSESVRNSAFIMLTFINELSLLFRDVRSFAFVNDITDITKIVKKREIRNIVTDILSGGIPNLFGNSNYSTSFYRFFNQYKGILKRDTIVIIIGDGRNNYNPPSIHYLNYIRKKVHRLYWFVPEPKRLWGKADSLLPLYQSIADKTFETCNLHQLSNAILNIAS